MNEKELLKFLESNAKFMQTQAKYLKSYYFHKRHKWLFYIPFYQMGYLWKVTLWGLKGEELIKQTAQLNILYRKKFNL